MSQRIWGVDVGSHAIKLAELEIGFKSVRLLNLHVIDVPPDLPVDFLGRLQLMQALPVSLQDAAISMTVPGDQAALRLLDIPVSDARRAAAIVGNQLADDLPWELDDCIYDYLNLPALQRKVFAAVMQRESVRSILHTLSEFKVEPRHLSVAPLGFSAMIRRQHQQGVVAILDFGHRFTNLAIYDDADLLYARSISGGGFLITEALHKKLQLSIREAQQLKHERGTLDSSVRYSDAEAKIIGDIIEQALDAIVVDIKQTLQLAHARTQRVVQQVVVCGGTALLRGLIPYLQHKLELPVVLLSMTKDPEFQMSGVSVEGEAVGALAVSTALDFGRRQRIDFRQEEFVYRIDQSLLRDRAGSFVVAAVALICCMGLSGYASLYGLKKQSLALQAQLVSQSQVVFGRSISNPKRVQSLIKEASPAAGQSIPTRSALDILDYISTHVPAASAAKLDVTRLDIKPGKTYVNGTADTRKAIGDVVSSLKKVACFSDVSSGTISEVSDEKKQFSLTINTKCF